MLTSLLWHFSNISGQEGYIFGSIHLNLDGHEQVLKSLEPVISNCDLMMTEVELNESDYFKVAHFINLLEGQSYQNLLGIKKWNKFSKLINSKLGRDGVVNYNLKPIILLNLLSSKLSGYSVHDEHMDSRLYNLAKTRGIKTQGLEDLVTHYSYLNTIPIKDQLKSLLKATKNLSTIKHQFDKIISAYKKQDIKLIYKISRKQLGKWKKIMLVKRNFLVLNTLKSQLDQHKPFVCVGAAHLAGQYGLLNLLKKNGYKLKPVFTKH